MKTDAGKRMRHTRAHRCLLAGLLLLLLAAGIHLPARGGAPLHTPGTAGFTLPALPEDTLEDAGADTIAPRRLSRAERRRREAAGLSTADSLQRHNEQNGNKEIEFAYRHIITDYNSLAPKGNLRLYVLTINGQSYYK